MRGEPTVCLWLRGSVTKLNLRRNWLDIFAAACVAVMLAFMFGVFGNRPYIFFAAAWLACAAALSQAKTRFPEFTETMTIFGWLILGFMGVGSILLFTLGTPYVR
jgi:hypothetical protein